MNRTQITLPPSTSPNRPLHRYLRAILQRMRRRPSDQESAEPPRPRALSRTAKLRSKAIGNGTGIDNGDEHRRATDDAQAFRPAPSPSADAVLRRLACAGAGLCVALSIVVLGISMPHLASGVSKITACQFHTALFMSVVFDLSQVAAEFSVLVMPLLGIASRRQHLVCAFIIAACTFVSMTLNVRAFLEHFTAPFETAMAFSWGGLLPILVLLLVFVASSFIMRLHAKPPTAAAPTAS